MNAPAGGEPAEQATIFGGEAVLVESLLPAARKRLMTVLEDAPLTNAAKLLRAGIDLGVVCGPEGAMVGIITKTDVVSQIGECQGSCCMMAASAVVMAIRRP